MNPDPFLQSLPAGTELPNAMQELHGYSGQYSGRCTVERGRGWLADFALRLGRMPLDGKDIPVRVTIDRDGLAWTWTRNFDGHNTQSRLTFERSSGCVREQFGQVSVWLRPVFSNEQLSLQICRLSFLGVKCPEFLLPRSHTVEWQDDRGRFRFDVSAEMPFLGTLIRYQGWLTPVHGQLGKD